MGSLINYKDGAVESIVYAELAELFR